MSTGNTWKVSYIDFSHLEFYGAIVEYFEAPPGPVAQAQVDSLLAWWNRWVTFTQGVQYADSNFIE